MHVLIMLVYLYTLYTYVLLIPLVPAHLHHSAITVFGGDTSHCHSLDNNVMYLQDGRTPLYIASGNGHNTVVQFLLQMFADVTFTKEVYMTHYMCVTI